MPVEMFIVTVIRENLLLLPGIELRILCPQLKAYYVYRLSYRSSTRGG
jgi:hypothetical protein